MKRSRAVAVTAVLAALAVVPLAYGGDDATSLSYISYLERYATLQPAQNQETLDAVVNMPVLTGDRLDTSRGARVEVQLADGSTVWVDEFSTLDFDALALSRDNPAEKTALYLSQGTVAVEIPPTAAGDGALRFDSPAGTLYLDRPGLFRIALSGDQIFVQAYSGLAELPVGVGSALLRGGEEATVDKSGSLQKAALSETTDDFWDWVQERRHPDATGLTGEHVDARDASRAGVLDYYGDWVYEPTFSSWMWRPRVAAGWAPYTDGRWYWTPVGWSWISYEPWGWYPSHYGSWYLSAEFGWVWGWDAVWAPAWVYWMYTPGYVGWCPRGYYDWWYYGEHHGGHHGEGGYPGGGGGHYPGRWSEVTYDFSGRVRMGQVDPHPWTFVPSSQFNSSNVERVRLDTSRFLRTLPGDRTGVVRSGPMLTQLPSRGVPERTIDSFFRQGGGERAVPDLTSILRREPGTGTQAGAPGTTFTPSRTTTEVARAPRVQLSTPPLRVTREGDSNRWVVRNTESERVRVDTRSEVPRGERTQVRSQGTAPAPVVRREVERPSSGTSERVAPPRANPRPERPPAESLRQRENSVSVQSERRSLRQAGPAVNPSSRWAAPVTRRAAPVRTYERPYTVEPRAQTRSVGVSREFAPQAPARTWSAPVSRGVTAHSAPAPRASSGYSAPRTSAPVRSGGGRGRH